MAMKMEMVREVEIERRGETEIAGKRWRDRDKDTYSRIKYRFYCVDILAHCVNRRWGPIF